MSGSTPNPPLTTIGTTQTPFYVGQTAAGIKLDYTVPAAGTTPPPAATVVTDTEGVVNATVAAPVAAPAGSPSGVGFTSDVTIVAVAPGTTVVRFLENNVDDGPAAEITVTVSSRPSDTVSVDASGLTITG